MQGSGSLDLTLDQGRSETVEYQAYGYNQRGATTSSPGVHVSKTRHNAGMGSRFCNTRVCDSPDLANMAGSSGCSVVHYLHDLLS